MPATTTRLVVRTLQPRRRGLIAWIVRMDMAWRQKRHLDRLSPAERRDMGLTPEVRGALTLADLADGIGRRSY